MMLNGWFGYWQTWALIAGAWVAGAIVTAIIFGVIARVEDWRERRGGK